MTLSILFPVLLTSGDIDADLFFPLFLAHQFQYEPVVIFLLNVFSGATFPQFKSLETRLPFSGNVQI